MDKKIIDYRVIETMGIDSLQREIKSLLGAGWLPLGGVSVVFLSNQGTGGLIKGYQAMVKYED